MIKCNNDMTEQQFKTFLRPLYTSILNFGYCTEEEVEFNLDTLWKNELEIRRLHKLEKRQQTMQKVEAVIWIILAAICLIAGSYFILKPTPKHHVKPSQESHVPYTKVF